jgi:hypothetical protein
MDPKEAERRRQQRSAKRALIVDHKDVSQAGYIFLPPEPDSTAEVVSPPASTEAPHPRQAPRPNHPPQAPQEPPQITVPIQSPNTLLKYSFLTYLLALLVGFWAPSFGFLLLWLVDFAVRFVIPQVRYSKDFDAVQFFLAIVSYFKRAKERYSPCVIAVIVGRVIGQRVYKHV